MTSPTEILATNPVSDILRVVKTHSVTIDYGLERTYTLSKSNKILNILREHPAANEDLRRIDHIALLDLYPQHEYIFGPYKDANAHEFNLVYILYSNRINQENELKVLYAGRVLLETIYESLLGQDPQVLDVQHYTQAVSTMQEVPNRRSVNCYYKDYTLSQEELAVARSIYKCTWVGQPRYNQLRENYTVALNGGNDVAGVNPFRLLYEIHYEKARLPSHKVVSPANGKKADVRVDNVVCRDLYEEDKERRRVAFEEFGLDTYALEKLTASKGFDRFRGIYTFDGPDVKPANKGRRYVKMVKDGTDIQIAPYLSQCLMMVKLARPLLDNETVDHIDHNHSNDSIENLRIIDKTTHASEDSVLLEVSSSVCMGCGQTFTMTPKAYSYFRHHPGPLVCGKECRSKVGRTLLRGEPVTHRYYIIDKATGNKLYFQSLNYDECRQILYKEGKTTF